MGALFQVSDDVLLKARGLLFDNAITVTQDGHDSRHTINSMHRPQEVSIGALPVDRFKPLVGEARVRSALKVAEQVRARLAGRVFWNVNSTAMGGGVAEMLRSILAYVRGLEIDTRWLVIGGSPEFFHITKRIHHALHGSNGDGSPLDKRERRVYEKVLRENAEELLSIIRPRDFVLLHDPQTLGLAPYLERAGAIVVWRCHIGQDEPTPEADKGWDFLAPYLDHVAVNVFSRDAYVPDCCDHGRSVVIPPSIDPFSAKNQELDGETTRSILVHAGLVEGPPGKKPPVFHREDGSPERVDRHADVMRLGRAPTFETPLVVQISRWDPLKDHIGVMHGFATIADELGPGPELVLAGPNVKAIPDDPEGAAVFDEVIDAWRQLPHAERNRIHLASLPMADVEENAAIVNALQRHAAIVVQKSLREGFGLTVTEAMWKGRPVIASAVGGIQDQIQDGVHGLLIQDPTDLETFGKMLQQLLTNRKLAKRLGKKARDRAREHYLGIRHLLQYAELIERIDT